MNFRDRAFLAALSGGAAATGHAPFGLWPLALLGFLCLTLLVAGGRRPEAVLPPGVPAHPTDLMEHAKIVRKHRPGWLAWFGGAAYFAVSMHWIVEPFLVDAATHGWMAPFALILLAGGLALFWALAGWSAVRLASTLGGRAMAFAFLLTAAEMTRGHIFTGFPWALPAYVWADTPLRAATAYTGSYGLTFLTLFGTALPLVFRSRWLGVVAGCALFLGLFGLGSHHVDYTQEGTNRLGEVRIVQPNVPQTEKWVRDKVPEHLSRMISLTRGDTDRSAQREIDMVVWPEAAVVYPLDQAGSIIEEAARAAREDAGPEAHVIFGINRRDEEGRWFNSMAVVAPDGKVKDVYDKVHLVPFGEYIPFRINFLRAMAAASGFGFTSGAQVRLIETPLGMALPLICYEGIFPGHIFRADERPDYLLQITNDAWFGTFSGPYQHLDQARFRAAEQGLPVVRAANTGISTVIDPFGAVDSVHSIALGRQGYRDALVWSNERPTLYSQMGDMPLLVLLLVTLGGLLVAKRRNTIAIHTPKS